MALLEILQKLIESNVETVILTLIFIVVVFVILAGGILFSAEDPIEIRLKGQRPRKLKKNKGRFFSFFSNGEPDDTNTLKNQEMIGLRYNLAKAGFTGRHASLIYSASQVFSAITLGVAVFTCFTLFAPEIRLLMVLAVSSASVFIGFMIPNVFISRRTAARLLEVEHSFPDALDMLLVSMEAGASLDSALNRVGKEISQAHPILSEHLESIGQELRAGTSREVAFRRFGKRIPIEDVRSFVALFIQTDRLGTSVAQALRVHAEEMRFKRVLRAEEKAHQLPVKLSVPLVLFILPALLLVIMTPAIIRIVRNFIF